MPPSRPAANLTVDPALIEAAAAALNQEPAFAAEALALPGEAMLADQMEVVDVDAIHAARDTARAAIGQALRDKLRATYDGLTDPSGYTVDGAAIGRRSLRNACLSYLVAAGDPAAVALAKAQFDAGQNMTDVLAALAILADVDCPQRPAALAAFYARLAPRSAGAGQVVRDPGAVVACPILSTPLRALKTHPDFDLRNPNRVRALVSSFAGNQVRFHDASGAGYKLTPIPSSSLTPPTARSPPAWSPRSGNGAASISPGRG